MPELLLICNKAPYPANDGSSIAIYNMARGLIDSGVRVKLLTINTKKNFKPDENVPPQFKKDTAYQSVYHNTNVTALGALMNLFSGESYFVSRFRFDRFAQALKKTLEGTRFDVVQIEGLFMAVYIPLIRRYSKARIVLRAHNIEHVIWTRHIEQEKSALKKWYLGLQNKRLRNFELRVFRDVDAIVPITSIDEASIRSMGFTGPMITCITGINPAEYRRPASKQQKHSVFYFGSMDWLPNQEAVTWFLKECWDNVKAQVPEARFFIAGRGMPLHFFHINTPGVSIIEEVKDPKDFFSQHQVLVVPLWSGSGLRIKIIEGMASGKAIVSTSIGAEGIGCTHGRNILIADTPEDFTRSLVELLRDEGRREALGSEAADLACREFDNTKVVRRLVDFYNTLGNG